jgi:hypothetical protein
MATQQQWNVLTSLPFYLLDHFISTWVELKDVCHLDTCFNNSKLILNYIKIEGIKITDLQPNSKFKSEIYFRWILKKKIILNHLFVNEWNTDTSIFNIIIHRGTNMIEDNNKNKLLALKSLVIDFNDRSFDYFDAKEFFKTFGLLDLIHLQEVCFTNVFHDEINREATYCLYLIAKYSENLKILNLQNCYKINDFQFSNICNFSQKVENINLNNCFHITDESLKMIANRCKNLKVLNLKDCKFISNDGFIELCNNCNLLENINLIHCFKINDDSLIAISKNCLNLKILYLNFDMKVTDRGVVEIAKNCLKLEIIGLFDCYKVTNVSFIELQKNCLFLKTNFYFV